MAQELTLKELAAQIEELSKEVSALREIVEAIPGETPPVAPHVLSAHMAGTPEQNAEIKALKAAVRAGGKEAAKAADMLKEFGIA